MNLLPSSGPGVWKLETVAGPVNTMNFSRANSAEPLKSVAYLLYFSILDIQFSLRDGYETCLNGFEGQELVLSLLQLAGRSLHALHALLQCLQGDLRRQAWLRSWVP